VNTPVKLMPGREGQTKIEQLYHVKLRSPAISGEDFFRTGGGGRTSSFEDDERGRRRPRALGERRNGPRRGAALGVGKNVPPIQFEGARMWGGPNSRRLQLAARSVVV